MKKGQTLSPEARAKMSAARKGRPGRPHSPESRAKISAAKKGQTLSCSRPPGRRIPFNPCFQTLESTKSRRKGCLAVFLDT
jgi:hypothetical protein